MQVNGTTNNRLGRASPPTYFHIYLSIAEAEAPLSDGHVAWLVQLAFHEMIGLFQMTIWRDNVVAERRRPAVMTALLLSPDRTVVVFSSSMRRLEGNVKPYDFANGRN